MKFELNDINSILSRDDINGIMNELTKTTVKTNLMNDVDVALFGSHLLVTDHEALLTQFIQTSVVWCHHIKKYEEKEEYELCGSMLKSLNKMEMKYIAFITTTEYNEDAINKIKQAKKLAIEKGLK